MYQLIITNKAIKDTENARNWYNQQKENLGFKYLDHIFECFEDIKKRPFIYPARYNSTREMVVRKYPYLIIFTVEEDYIFVLRVFPCKMDPKRKYK
jgi:plasmid stabilization system protein ParE